MKRSLTYLGLLLALLSGVSFAAISDSAPATLPGGTMFPHFPLAAIVNPAGISQSWRTEVIGLYGPPINENEPHSYLLGIGHGNGRWGVNVGYSGSLWDSQTFHNAYAGFGITWKKISFGISAQKADLMSDSPAALNLGVMYSLGRILRVGLVGYNLTGQKQLGAGLGIGRAGRWTVAGDFLVPVSGAGTITTREYSASGTVTYQLNRLGISLGAKYSEIDLYNTTEKRISGNAAIGITLTGNFTLLTTFRTDPQSIGLAIVWRRSASSLEQIDRANARAGTPL